MSAPIKVLYQNSSAEAVIEVPVDKLSELIDACNRRFFPHGPNIGGPEMPVEPKPVLRRKLKPA